MAFAAIAPALIGAGANILGGILGRPNTGGQLDAAMETMQQQYKLNLDTIGNQDSVRAQGLRDAEKRFGINPLAMLGVGNSSFSGSGVSVGDGANSALASGVSAAGQDLSRAAAAMAPEAVRKQKLEGDLLEAQIANVNSDTVKNQAAASRAVTGAPTAPTPLYQTFLDPWGRRTVLPSDKAASPMQTITAWPSNLAIGAQMLYHNLMNDWPSKMGGPVSRGDVHRAHNPTRLYIDVPNR